MASLWRHPNSDFWTACYTDKDGRRIKRSTKQTNKKKAMLIALEWERVELQSRRQVVSTRQIQKVFNDLLEKTNEEAIVTPSTEKYLGDWLTSIETKKSKGTFERYEHTVDLFLKHIGTAARSPVTSINSSHVEGFLDARLKAGVAPKTAVVDIKTLNVAFNRAERYSVILKNPVTAVEMPKVESSERDIFTPEQVAKLLQTVGPKSDWFTLILLGYFTGQRLGDCVTLEWKQVDMRNHVIHFKQKKTGKKVAVPMTEDLDEHLQFLSEFIDGKFVCPELAERGSGGAHGLSESFGRIVKRAGIDSQRIKGKGNIHFNRLTFHSLRHSFNSTMAEAGVSQETRMKLTGHSSILMNDRYTHTSLKPLEDAVSKMPSLLDRPLVEDKTGKKHEAVKPQQTERAITTKRKSKTGSKSGNGFKT
jgi:integrase